MQNVNKIENKIVFTQNNRQYPMFLQMLVYRQHFEIKWDMIFMFVHTFTALLMTLTISTRSDGL